MTNDPAPPADTCPWGLLADLGGAISLDELASSAVQALSRLCRARACAFAICTGRNCQIVRSRRITVPAARRLLNRVDGQAQDSARLERPAPGGERAAVLAIPCSGLEARLLIGGPELDTRWLEANLEGLGGLLRACIDRMSTPPAEEGPMALLSHEMRTPLTSIKGYATSLLRQSFARDPAAVSEFARLIAEEADMLSQMIAEVLEANSPEISKLELSREPVLATKLVQAIVGEISINDPDHRYVCCIPRQLPLIWADPARLKQVLRNLLDNARRYAVPGLVMIRAAEDGEEVRFSVADEGPGIKPEHVNRLFERYFRVRNHGSNVYGTGLGLPLARVIVERHGGRIWAISEEGKGTTFSFTIPIWRNNGVRS